jgi:hypothetical protein
VPSGGDWSLHRDGAVLFDNVEQVAVSNCTFVNLGGNGAVLSNHVLNSSITDCEMTQLGDSGIVSGYCYRCVLSSLQHVLDCIWT